MTNEFFDNHDKILDAFQGKSPEDLEATRAKFAKIVPGVRVKYVGRGNFMDFMIGKVGTVQEVGKSPLIGGPDEAAAVLFDTHKNMGPAWMGIRNLEIVDEPAPATEAKKQDETDLPKGQQEAEFVGEIDKNYKGPSKEQIRVEKILDPIRDKIIKYLDAHEIDYYIDYRDELGDENIKKIVEETAEKGYYSVRDEIWENNIDYQSDQEYELFTEVQKEFDLDDEESDNYVEVSDLRDEFMDYVKYGDDIAEQLIDKTDVYVRIQVIPSIYPIKDNGPHPVSSQNPPKDVLRFFKELALLTGGTLHVDEMAEKFMATQWDDVSFESYDGLTIYGKMDLRDIVDYKVKETTPFLKIEGGAIVLSDSGADPDYDESLEFKKSPFLIIKNKVRKIEKKNASEERSDTFFFYVDDDFQNTDGIHLTPMSVKEVKGFSMKAHVEAAKLPVVGKKLTKWYEKMEADKKAEEEAAEASRQEEARWTTWRVALEERARALVRAQPVTYWVDMDKNLDRDDSAWKRELVAEWTPKFQSEFEKDHPDAKLSTGRFERELQVQIGQYVRDEQKKRAEQEKKKQHRVAYDAAIAKKPKLMGKSWEDMYPEDAEGTPAEPKEETKESVSEAEETPFQFSGKSEEDKEETAKELQQQQDEMESGTEEWVRIARRELEAELGCRIKLTDIDEVDSGRCRMEKIAGESNNGEHSWMVFKDQDAADDFGHDYVREQIEQYPENFNQSFIEQHISISETDKGMIAQEEADDYVDNVLGEDDVLEEAGMTGEWEEIENDETMEEQAKEDKKGELVETAKEIVRDKKYDEVKDALEDPIGYFVTERGIYSIEDLLKASFIHIDADEAADDAISADGLAHFLDAYDSAEVELPSGAIAFGEG